MDDFNLDGDDSDIRYKFLFPYRGIVVDDRDPRDVGRVKIRVEGVYSKEVPVEDIPWAIPALSIYRSGGDNSRTSMSDEKAIKNGYNNTGTGGIFTVPRVGSHVWVFFDRGNHMYPVYWAASPGDSDWITQKMVVKDKIDNKIDQIGKFKKKFSPVQSADGTDGTDWADGAHVNPRTNIKSEGQSTPYGLNSDLGEKANSGNTKIKKQSGYEPRKLHIDNADTNGKSSKNMESIKERSFGNMVGLDIKPLFDKEDITGIIDRSTKPHKIDNDESLDEVEETKRNINRYITSFTTVGGTTIIIDNREEQENFYLIHKNYIFNVDEEGSAKEFCGKNESSKESIKDEGDARGNTSPDIKTRANKETGVEGDYKIHVLGNFVTYTKGNVFMQVDKNMQVDVNDSYGLRVRKGDVDIIIEGEKSDTKRDANSDREDGKLTQQGDLNIDVKNGHIEIHVKENANIHVEKQCNLKVDEDMKVHVGNSYHLHVEGDYSEYIAGSKYSTVKKDNENRIEGYVKTEIFGNKSIEVHKHDTRLVGGSIIAGCWGHLDLLGVRGNRIYAPYSSFSGDVIAEGNVSTTFTNLNAYFMHSHRGVSVGAGVSSPFGDQSLYDKVPRPADPLRAYNAGGGITPDKDDDNSTMGLDSDMTGKNKTKKAKRRNKNRLQNTDIKSAVPI